MAVVSVLIGVTGVRGWECGVMLRDFAASGRLLRHSGQSVAQAICLPSGTLLSASRDGLVEMAYFDVFKWRFELALRARWASSS